MMGALGVAALSDASGRALASQWGGAATSAPALRAMRPGRDGMMRPIRVTGQRNS